MVAILRHGQHVKTLLSLIGTLLDGHDFFEQRRCLLELATGEELLGIFVSGICIAVLIDSIKF